MSKPWTRISGVRRQIGPPSGHRAVVMRLGLILVLGLVALEMFRSRVLELALRALGREISDPVAYTASGIALSIVVAVALTALLGFLLSRWLTARLVRISKVASLPVEDGELPGPFDESGDDEVAIVAATMNAMRDQVAARLKEFSLRDIRRREFIAQVSHDLRTPLTAQLACLDRATALLDKPGGELNHKELRELLIVAKMDADRVHTLADDLLEIARLDAGDRLNLEPVPPGELVRQAARSLAPLAAQRGIKIDVRVTPGLPILHADGRRLIRGFENLMRNAIRHARTEVVAMAILAGGCVRFEVRDDGRGLPKQQDFLGYLRRLSKEVRLTKLAERRSGPDSAGLGLVVAQRVAEAHNGVVDAYDLRDSGAAFFIAIPIPDDEA